MAAWRSVLYPLRNASKNVPSKNKWKNPELLFLETCNGASSLVLHPHWFCLMDTVNIYDEAVRYALNHNHTVHWVIRDEQVCKIGLFCAAPSVGGISKVKGESAGYILTRKRVLI